MDLRDGIARAVSDLLGRLATVGPFDELWDGVDPRFDAFERGAEPTEEGRTVRPPRVWP